MVELSGVSKTYRQGSNQIRALEEVELSIKPGDFLAIMGPSGSGKSTLLNVLGLLDKPDAGSYQFEGREVAALDDDAASELRNCRIGFVFQSFHLLPRLSVLENVLLPQRYAKIKNPVAMQHARELLERLGLAGRVDHKPGELSGGQLQRAAIARSLLNRPALLLADEPTGNLDSKNARDVLALLTELNATGQTLIMVTHDPEIAETAQRTVHLRDGRIEKIAT